MFPSLGLSSGLKRSSLCCAAALLMLIPSLSSAAELLDETKALVQEWVRTEQLISQENRQWREEKSSIEDLLSILEAEQRVLNEQISLAQETATRADEERAALVEQLSAYQAISGELEDRVSEYERQLMVLQPRLPGALQRELAPRFSRIENPDQANLRSLSERVQIITSLLAEIGAFDSTVVLTTEIIPVAETGDIEARVMYLGLSRAYFVNGNGSGAGVGIPGAAGWQWQQINELAAEISEAMDVYESRVSPQLVELPIQVSR